MYEWVEHTGEVELAIEADSEAAVFAEALTALAELLGEELRDKPARYEIEVEATDRAALLVEWLSELVFLAETEAFVPERVARLLLEGDVLRATIEGRRGSPPHFVKAVTYHNLAFAQEAGRWWARVVLDV